MQCFICSESQPAFHLSIMNEAEVGDNVVVSRFNHHPKQIFTVYSDYILSSHSGNCLSANASFEEGSAIVADKFNNNPSQFFRFHPDGTIRNNSGMILVVKGPLNDNAQVVLVHAKENNIFKWRVVTRK